MIKSNDLNPLSNWWCGLFIHTWAAPARTRNRITKNGWNLEKNGNNIVAIDEVNITKAKKRFGPRKLTATDEAICVKA